MIKSTVKPQYFNSTPENGNRTYIGLIETSIVKGNGDILMKGEEISTGREK